MPLNNQWVTEEIKNCLETNEHKNRMMHNLRDTTKTVLRVKFIVIQAYPRKQEKSQINNLTLHLRN